MKIIQIAIQKKAKDKLLKAERIEKTREEKRTKLYKMR